MTGRVTTIVLFALGGYLTVCVLLFVFQRRLIYLPFRWTEQEASRANPGYEEVRIRTQDGETLHGWLRRREDARWTVAIFHGNAGNLSVQDALMVPFIELDLQVLLFDYRGFGLSSGSPSEEGLVRDGVAVARYVEEALDVPPARIVYHGKSLGTGVAVLVAARRPPARLILESAYDSLGSVAAHHYPFLPVRRFLKDRYDAAAVIGELGCPILFVHPEQDEIIPVAAGRALFERAPEPKRFVTIPGARHNDPPALYPPLYLAAVREFLSMKGEGGELVPAREE